MTYSACCLSTHHRGRCEVCNRPCETITEDQRDEIRFGELWNAAKDDMREARGDRGIITAVQTLAQNQATYNHN